MTRIPGWVMQDLSHLGPGISSIEGKVSFREVGVRIQASILNESRAEFDLEEECIMNIMPDNADWYSCQDCHEGRQRLVEKMGF